MARQIVAVRGRKTAVLVDGDGDPLVYLHGFADVHGVAEDFQPFHLALCKTARVFAPAHPGCAGSDDLPETAIDDVIFHCLELLDALELDKFDLVGHCAGGWIAAELAVRHPERVRKLALIDACGLFVSGQPIGDVFMHAQPERGADYSSLRHLLFADAAAPVATRFFPDGRGDIEDEVRRYQMLRFGSFIGFKPPYFYQRSLRDRLHRARMPALVAWGADDHMVPRSHGDEYVAGLPGADRLHVVAGAGHAAPLEQPDATAALLAAFIRQT